MSNIGMVKCMENPLFPKWLISAEKWTLRGKRGETGPKGWGNNWEMREKERERQKEHQGRKKWSQGLPRRRFEYAFNVEF